MTYFWTSMIMKIQCIIWKCGDRGIWTDPVDEKKQWQKEYMKDMPFDDCIPPTVFNSSRSLVRFPHRVRFKFRIFFVFENWLSLPGLVLIYINGPLMDRQSTVAKSLVFIHHSGINLQSKNQGLLQQSFLDDPLIIWRTLKKNKKRKKL